MKTFKARYRDIDIEDVRKCFPTADAMDWDRVKGQEATFNAQDNCDARDIGVCNQPLYKEADSHFIACSHIAEIGD